MRSRRVFAGITIALALALAQASPAGAASDYVFEGDRGTRCVVQVGAVASHALNALQLPRVGFSANPTCAYARSQPGSDSGQADDNPTSGERGSPSKKSAKKRKRCKKPGKRRGARKGKGKRKRGCKKKRKKKSKRRATRADGSRAYAGTVDDARAYAGAARGVPAAPLPAAALLGQAKLLLVGGAGAPLPGEQTLGSLGAGGYSCALAAGASCADSGNLSPATPQLSYLARYEFTLAPPAGERWIVRPAPCDGAAAPRCVLEDGPVTPVVL